MLRVRQQQAISTVHPLPVVFIRRSTNETDLIVLPIAIESWPSKPMGAQFSDESLQEFHVYPSLRHGPELGSGIVLKRRVNQFDSSRAHFQLTGVHCETGYRAPDGLLHFVYSALACFRMGMSGSAHSMRTLVPLRQELILAFFS